MALLGGGSGNACLVKTGSGHLNVLSYVQNSIGACVNQGTMSFNNRFDGDVRIGAGGVGSGSGLVNGNIIVTGSLAPGNSPGVLVVNGSVTQLAGSTLDLDIDGATAGNGAGHHDALVLTGPDSVYTAAGAIVPHLRGITGDATNSFTPAIGQTFEVVTAEGGVTGSFDAITQPIAGMPANTRFSVLYGANSVRLAVTPGSYALIDGGVANRVSAGGALDALLLSGGPATPTATLLLGRLAALDAAQIGQSLEQLSGSIHASTMDATLQGNRIARSNVFDHLTFNRAAADNGAAPARGLWGSVSGLNGTVKADGSGSGYKVESRNYAVGFDIAPSAEWTIGLAGGYSESRANAAQYGRGETKSYQGSLYAAWSRSGSYAAAQFAISVDRYAASILPAASWLSIPRRMARPTGARSRRGIASN